MPTNKSETGSLSYKKIALLGAILLTVIGLISLGTWQLSRLGWKLDLIEYAQQRASSAAVAPPSSAIWRKLKARDYEYQKLRVSGELLHRYEKQIYTLSSLGPGYWILTPLKTSQNDLIYVNLGWVPMDRKSPATRMSQNLFPGSNEKVTIEGLLRLPNKNAFQIRHNQPQQDLWYFHDLKAMAEHSGIGQAAPFYIDKAKGPQQTVGAPIAGLTKLQFRNSHLVYAITWYALALLLAGLTFYVIRLESKP